MFLLSVGRPYYWKIVGMGKGTNWEKIEQVEGVSTLIVFLILVDRVLTLTMASAILLSLYLFVNCFCVLYRRNSSPATS